MWLRVHASDAPELAPSSHQLALFASGHRVGAAAQQCLADGRTNAVAQEPLRRHEWALYRNDHSCTVHGVAHQGPGKGTDSRSRLDFY